MPTIVLGIGLLILASRYLGGTVVRGAGRRPCRASRVPFVVRTVGAVLAGVDRATEEAARVMGAPWWQRYWLVVLPQARAGLAAGAFFAFIVSFDDAVLVLFLRAPGVETLPLLIYGKLEFSPDPGVAAAVDTDDPDDGAGHGRARPRCSASSGWLPDGRVTSKISPSASARPIALDGVSLAIPTARFVALLGPIGLRQDHAAAPARPASKRPTAGRSRSARTT